MQTGWVWLGVLTVLALYAEMRGLRSPLIFVGGTVICVLMIAIGIVLEVAAEPSTDAREDRSGPVV